MNDEWLTVMSGDRLVTFAYVDLPGGAAFLTAQIAGHHVVYSIMLDTPDRPFSRARVEHRFDQELRPVSH
jgi:hypothetical protein